jgi:hypothetical protein
LDLRRLRHLRLHISTPSHAFYTKHDRILPIPDMQAGIFTAQPDLSPDQAPLDTSRGIPPLQGNQASHPDDARCGANRSATYDKGMSWQQSIASNALAHESPKHAFGRRADQSAQSAAR